MQDERAVRPHVSIKARLSLMSPLMLSTAGKLSNEVHQTCRCMHLWKTGSLLARLSCYLKLLHLKPHTCTSEDILQWFGLWAHIPGLLLPLMMWSLSWKTLSSYFMAYLCSMIQSPPYPTMHIWGSSTSAHCWPPLPPAEATSALPLGEQHKHVEKNSTALATECLLIRCPNAASQWHPEQFIPSFLWSTW